MKESELKKILTKPVMDQTMDQKIADSLLYHDANINNVGWRRLFTQKTLRFGISKIAVLIFLLAIVGVGSAWAAGLYVKSYFTDIKVMTEEEIEDDSDLVIRFDRENATRKRFGTGNKMIGLLKDMNGNIPEIDADGYYVFEDGSKFLAPYIPDPNRHENARKSGDEAFAEIDYPNLVPTYLYDNYVLGVDGFVYTMITQENKVVLKEIMVEFFTDAYDTGDFLKENIWITFHSSETSVKDSKSIHMSYDENDDNYIYSSYTTKGGIICSILEEVDRNSIIVHISFDSETIGNGRMMIQFKGLEMDKINEILDTIPLTEGNVDTQIVE
ncbi:MAG: hypothetical protein K0S47_4803 [Herbinix sp.]|jgi:hypothetical protein|nr:hypothetical protein [Herbinix sp.]